MDTAGAPRVRTLAEVLASLPSVEDQLKPELWRFDPEMLTLTSKTPPTPYEYKIDLEKLTTSAEVLGLIMQVAGKSWAPDSVLSSLVRCLDLLFNPQATLCSWGKERGPINPRKVIECELRAHLKWGRPVQ